MAMIIRNIEKRKELQQAVYDNYCILTNEELKGLDNEVGAAFRGYVTAMEEIVQLIVDGREDGETLAAIKEHISRQFGDMTGKHPFRFSEVPTTKMKDYINTTVKNELIHKGESEERAAEICEGFIKYPALREDVIDRYELDSIRICEHCGAPMNEGYLVNDCETYCSEECAKAALLSHEGGWTEETFNEHLAHADEEDSVIYWTQWEG